MIGRLQGWRAENLELFEAALQPSLLALAVCTTLQLAPPVNQRAPWHNNTGETFPVTASMAASSQDAIVLTLVRNINRKDVRTIKLQHSSPTDHGAAVASQLVPALMQAAANKFKLKRKDVRLFDGKSGLELVLGNGECKAAIK